MCCLVFDLLCSKQLPAKRGRVHNLWIGVFVLKAATAAMLIPCGCAGQTFALDSTKGLQPHDVTVEAVTYQGRKAVRVTPAAAADTEMVGAKNHEGGGIVVLSGAPFHNGAIEADLAGKPRAGAAAGARGFVGLAFRVAAEPSAYEGVYIRPTNGRADDQLRRNHSTQYISMPDYDWSRLRKQAPGEYESYVDLVPGEWTRIKIEVAGIKARLYVNGAPQPVLLVNDLKHGDSTGSVALWIGFGTEGYFANLRISD